MEEEIWKEIEGFDGMYEVSNIGRVRSWKSGNYGRRKEPKILKIKPNQDGYIGLVITHNTEKKSFKIHRLVGVCFIDNPQNLVYIDHIDGNKTNNHFLNLRWTSMSENAMNTKIRTDNSSGYKGVSFHKGCKKWCSVWSENGRLNSKSFKTKEEAIEHRRKMVELHYPKEYYIEDR